MRTPTKQMLNAEFVLQSLLFVPMVLAYFYSMGNGGAAILALLLQFFLGLLQVFTALIRVIRHQSQIRKKYLFAAITYVLSLIAAMYIFDDVSMSKGQFWWIAFGIVVPVCMASFYWGLTLMQLRGKYIEIDMPRREIDLSTIDNEDIMIDEIMNRHKQRIVK